MTFDDCEDECPYCDGEGWDADACDCMEGCVACIEPSGMPCHHCTPQQAGPELQQILGEALENRQPTEYPSTNVEKENTMNDELKEYVDQCCRANKPDTLPGQMARAAKIQCETIAHPVLDNMTFGQALTLLKQGIRVARKGWNGKGMFLYLVNGSTFKVNRPPLLGIYPEGTEINYGAHIDMKTADDTCVPWLASQTDVLAEDWVAVGTITQESAEDTASAAAA